MNVERLYFNIYLWFNGALKIIVDLTELKTNSTESKNSMNSHEKRK
jgi:hypothetical protein